jgi:hypothetical protein
LTELPALAWRALAVTGMKDRFSIATHFHNLPTFAEVRGLPERGDLPPANEIIGPESSRQHDAASRFHGPLWVDNRAVGEDLERM